MKISQIEDKKIDQNEIESKYYWNISQENPPYKIDRFNISTLSIDFSKNYSEIPCADILQIIPNNQVFGIMFENIEKQFYHHLFIADKNFNFKVIETNSNNSLHILYLVSCFYDDAIFTFGYDDGLGNGGKKIAKKYLILENRWANMTFFPYNYPESFTGFNQKIVFIAKGRQELLVYDIILDSYSHYSPIEKDDFIISKKLIKYSGKLYLIAYLDEGIYQIKFCTDPLSEWTFVYNYKDNPLRYELIDNFSQWAYYEGFIYFLSKKSIYQFELKKFELKAVGQFS